MTIDPSLSLKPINIATYSYTSDVSDYDAMLLFQRRKNDQPISFIDNQSGTNMAGTLYAKWAQFIFSGSNGTYPAQFIGGSMKILGKTEITVSYDGTSTKGGAAPQLFLVE